MRKLLGTCIKSNCTERKGGRCTEFDYLESDTSLVSIFLQESNGIEGVYDEKSLKQAITAWRYLEKQSTLTIEVVLETHRLLMIDQPIEEHQKGQFRQQPVWVSGRECLHHTLIERAVEGWLLFMSEERKNMDDPEEWVKQCHIQYELIHPFIDGNGRTGRMFMNWQRLNLGLPLMVVFEHDKYEYYKWFDLPG